MTVSLLHQPQHNRVCAHLLSYAPIRKSIQIDVIEERTKLHDVTLELNLPYPVKSAVLVPKELNCPLKMEESRFLRLTVMRLFPLSLYDR